MITVAIVFEIVSVWKAKSQSFDLHYIGKDVFIHVTVSSTQPIFADGTKVTIHAFGSIGTRSVRSAFDNVGVLYANIADVCVLFSGAYQVVGDQVILDPNPEPRAGACLLITNTRPSESYNLTDWMQFGPGAFLSANDQTIQWSSPIESVPSILIKYWGFLMIDGVLRNSISEDYPSKSVLVESHSALDLAKTEMKGFVLAAIGSIFTLVLYLAPAITKLRQQKRRKIN